MRKLFVLSLTLCLLFSFAFSANALTINVEPEDQTIQVGFSAYWTIATTGQKKFQNVRSDGTSKTWYNYPDGEYTDRHVYDDEAIYIGHGIAWYNSSTRVDYWGCTVN